VSNWWVQFSSVQFSAVSGAEWSGAKRSEATMVEPQVSGAARRSAELEINDATSGCHNFS